MSVTKLSVGIVGLLLGLGAAAARADAPNFYQCQGKNITLNFYDKSAFNAQTLIDLQWGKAHYAINGANIESKNTVFGTVKSFTVRILPDVDVTKVSFIIPTINLGANFAGDVLEEASFKSELVRTTIVTPFILGPYIGVVNDSDYHDLKCKGSMALIPL